MGTTGITALPLFSLSKPTDTPTVTNTNWGTIVIFNGDNWNEFYESCLGALAAADALAIIQGDEEEPDDPFDISYITDLRIYKKKRGNAISIINSTVNSRNFVINSNQSLQEAMVTLTIAEKPYTATANYAGRGKGCGGNRGGCGCGGKRNGYRGGSGGNGGDSGDSASRSFSEGKASLAVGDQYNGTIYTGVAMRATDSKDNTWILDSGVSNHFTGILENLDHFQYWKESRKSKGSYIYQYTTIFDIIHLFLNEEGERNLDETYTELVHYHLGHLNYNQMDKLKKALVGLKFAKRVKTKGQRVEIRKIGIQFKPLPPGKHSINGVAEKKIQDVSARSRNLLAQAGMPEN
ncbi:hypothetical protein SBOR_4197 [Sclerotinia borealis F-4128]|uniref:Uncharacterized protein n=1 Tax=Sclerotinia borealis (strain F-4128) TaxID=1432307 RepID=W9CHW9_SCLBF|nr:hypothetical protein SBOR_4197 [Sclerotinia borealis F-4128]